MSTQVKGRPPRCGECMHTVREGETYEDRMWESTSRGPYPGVVHTPACPTDSPDAVVPCPPCLAQHLVGRLAVPHACFGSTTLKVRDGQLIATGSRGCPCSCRKGRTAAGRGRP